jgi:predicted alpha/beta-fold hydrolase
MAARAFDASWSVLRLNLRDHGGGYHLNREFFNSGRIDEVVGAVACARGLEPRGALAIVGFSLGGNFALRLGLHGPGAGLAPQLSIGICPTLNPDATMRAIDSGPAMFRWHFNRRWRRSLNAKAAAWPGAHDIRRHLALPGMVEGTRMFVEDFTEFAGYAEYIAAYRLTPAMLMTAPSPLAVITAQDDPVIPFADFAGLEVRGAVRAFEAPAHGGHCGFIENFRCGSWAERKVIEWLGGL